MSRRPKAGKRPAAPRTPEEARELAQIAELGMSHHQVMSAIERRYGPLVKTDPAAALISVVLGGVADATLATYKHHLPAEIAIEHHMLPAAERITTLMEEYGQFERDRLAAELAQEREMTLASVESAAADVTRERKRAEKAEAALADATRKHRENGQRNRDMAAAEVRAANERARDAEQAASGLLLRQTALETELAEARALLAAATTPEEPMPAPRARNTEKPEPITTTSAAHAMHLTRYLKAHGIPASNRSNIVYPEVHPGALLNAYAAEHYSEAKIRAALLRVVRSHMFRVAAP